MPTTAGFYADRAFRDETLLRCILLPLEDARARLFEPLRSRLSPRGDMRACRVVCACG